MLLFSSLLAAIIPMVLYLIFLWYLDKYEREPIKLLLRSFLWGAFGAIFFAIIFSEIVSGFFSTFTDDISLLGLLGTVLIAPFVEELVKGIYLIKRINSKNFDNLTDGLVYGGAIGLGFGMTENFLYFTTYGDTFESWLYLVIIRSVFSAVMHAIATGTLGAFLSFAKFSQKPARYIWIFTGFLSAMIIHFLWNFSVSFEETFIYGILFMLIAISSFFVVFNISLKRERKIILFELNDEKIDNALISEFLSHKGKRNITKENKGIITKYVKLAFRKHQIQFCVPKKKNFYIKEIELLRNEIASLSPQNIE